MLHSLFKATFLGVALLSFGCSADSKKDEAKSEPEIVRAEPGTRPSGAPSAGVDIIRTSTGSAAGSTVCRPDASLPPGILQATAER